MKDMGLEKEKTDHKFTYKDYSSWPDDERWELIDGVAYNMCAAPVRKHQELSFKLTVLIGEYLKGKDCKAVYSPLRCLSP